ncbi:hypothetical protein MXB_2629, partial [Myxobolus squamalis]
MFKKFKQETKVDEISSVAETLCRLYKQKLAPLEIAYKFHELCRPKLEDADFTSVPTVMFIGQYSTGKTTLIRYLLNEDYSGLRIGPEPTTDQFVAVMHGTHPRAIPGNAAVADPQKPFRALSKFGNNFLKRFTVAELPNDLCKGLTMIDTPGVLSGEKQTLVRGYPFNEIIQTLGEKCDRIYLLFDAHKLDISDEFRSAIETLKDYDAKIRALMRVYGALMWALGKVFTTPEVKRVYIGSFWPEPLQFDDNKKLFELEEMDLMKDMLQLPSSSIMRKLDDVISRSRLAMTNALILAEISQSMPSMLFKAKKKAEILDKLQDIFSKVQTESGIPAGDFPQIDEYREKLRHLDFSKFPPLKKRLIEDVKTMLSIDIPKLIQKIPSEDSSHPQKSALSGGIFVNLNLAEEDKNVTNPYSENAESKILLGALKGEWIVKRSQPRYDE